MSKIPKKEEINEEDLEFLKNIFGNSNQNHVLSSKFQELDDLKNQKSTQSSSKKVMIQITDDSKKMISDTLQEFAHSEKLSRETVRTPKEEKKTKTRKKRKKSNKQKNKDLTNLKILLEENNVLLRDLNQHFKTLQSKLRNFTEKPIKIEILK